MIITSLIQTTALTTATSPLPNLETTFLIVVALTVLALLIYAVFFFGRKLVTWGHFRDGILDNEKRLQYAKLLEDLYSEAERGPLDPNDPPPDAFGPVAQLWSSSYTGYFYTSALGSPSPPIYPQDYKDDKTFEYAKQLREQEEKARTEDLRLCREWEKREKVRFAARDAELKKKAAEIAERRTPKSMDVSFLGQGWMFLLEFSTVIVIIFSLVILGFLGILDGTQIAPILAAIAGYVLGKTSSEAAKGKEETGKAATDRAVAEITAKKAAEDKAAAEKTAEKAAADKSVAEEAADKAAKEKAAADEAAKKAAEDRAAAEEAAKKVKK